MANAQYQVVFNKKDCLEKKSFSAALLTRQSDCSSLGGNNLHVYSQSVASPCLLKFCKTESHGLVEASDKLCAHKNKFHFQVKTTSKECEKFSGYSNTPGLAPSDFTDCALQFCHSNVSNESDIWSKFVVIQPVGKCLGSQLKIHLLIKSKNQCQEIGGHVKEKAYNFYNCLMSFCYTEPSRRISFYNLYFKIE